MQAITMFDGQKVGCYLDDIKHGVIVAKKPSDKDVSTVDLAWRLEPFTLAQASALAWEVRKTLFMLSNGEPAAHVGRIVFKLGIPQQNVSLYPSPDTRHSSRGFVRCDIKAIVAKPSSAGRGWALLFRTVYAPPNPSGIGFLMDMLHKELWLEFMATDPTLDLGETSPQREAEEAEERALRTLEGELAQGKYGEERARAVSELPLEGQAETERARRPSFRHADRKARQRAKQPKATKRVKRSRSAKR